MCFGIPGLVLEINGDSAKVTVGGAKKVISTKLLSKVNVGDYVIVHAGFAIEKVDERLAEETLDLIGKRGIRF